MIFPIDEINNSMYECKSRRAWPHLDG